ncbi:DNA ligase D [Geomonas paludis]|uniref:DNA ligase (ATP) n=1 Tax=Geomonas paludis TaxID=2740185 RepID=A0A6V8MU68_9BACT|nr:DNA ligase D [Geomonas paludis]UPU38048.1 DNA ligase D [Geomonas paludis]GFO63424.1 ATP-dependent DNA ligase [Geomonas paludis]
MADPTDKSPHQQGLQRYREMRDFSRTPEPSGSQSPPGDIFVVQKHAASHLHYDFRLRLHGALKSWALSKGPSLDPGQHRLASQTEDHPLDYASFEGIIPAGNYGAGTVLIWDQGTWEPLEGGKGDYYRGRLHFILHGERLKGRWTLTRQQDDPKKWMLTKDNDEYATQQDPLSQETSVVSGRTLEEIAQDRDRLWTSDQGEVASRAGFGHVPGGSLPAYLEPQAATLVEQVPVGDEWLHEIKYDGYRMVCRIDKPGNGVRFYSRKGYDFTGRLKSLKQAMLALPLEQGWFDGEILVFSASGGSDFHALQQAFKEGKEAGIVYLVFDLMNYEGYDLRGAPLVERKALLQELLPPDGPVRFVDHVVGQGREFFAAVCEQRLEGVLSKRLDAEYQSQRTKTWLKVKCAQRQEFVVGGFTESDAGRPFGSMLAGYYNDRDELVFAGKIKTGYSIDASLALLQTMQPYEQPEPSFVNPPSGEEYRNPHWLKPELVAEVAFVELSGSGLLRHASFKGLREDKKAIEVRLEEPELLQDEPVPPTPQPPPAFADRSATARRPVKGGGVPSVDDVHDVHHVRHTGEQAEAPPSPPPLSRRARGELPRPGKVVPVFPHERITREDIERYYEAVAPRMLPYLADRPLTLISCRTNIYACKFTKHATNIPAPVKAVDAGHEERYIAIDSWPALQVLVRLGVVEIHAWQSRYTDLEHPDRMLFDLDPPEDESLPWERLVEAALMLRIHLQEYGLESYLQTTGGKGYYVVVPLLPAAAWPEMTGFSKRISKEMEAKYPDRFTAQLAKEKRGGRIYLDWMRNGRGANAAEPYSLRARPGAPVATPITWEEMVAGARPAYFNLRNIPERLAALSQDPWPGYFELRQKLPG